MQPSVAPGGVYYMNEAAFELPDLPLKDVTVTALDATGPSGDPLGIRVHRQPLPPKKTLREIVAEHVAEARRSLPSYELADQREIEVAGVPAIAIAARWRGQAGMNYTRHAHLAVQGLWLIVSVNGGLGDIAAVDHVVDHVLSTLRFAR
jgi:hypothetical protein